MARRPNLLWIFSDQLRWHALSCNGESNVRTPNIDRLAAQGARFENAFSHCPVCIPFRAGLVTGQLPSACGVPLHGDFLHPGRRTIAHAFRDAGYRTSYVGKWHLAGEHGVQKIYGNQWAGADYWVHPELRGGFEDWFGFNLSNNYYSTFYSRGEQVEPFKVEGYQTDGLFDLSIDCLSGHDSSRPWFHVLSFEAPHGGQGGPPRFPGHPAPPRYEAMFEPERIALRGNVPAQTEAQARKQLCGYYAMIANIDDNVGRLLDWLDSSGQADNTLVVFFADHGDMMGSHGRFNKQVPHEESIRIPLIMRMPGVIRPGATVGALASGIDIYPTCAGLCGVPAAADVQGMDLAGLLDGTGAAERTDVFIQWIGKTRFEFGDHPYRAIRSRRYTFSVGRDEQFNLLFDNEADPYQMNNLFGDPGTAEVKRQLLLRLKRATLRAGEPAPDFLERALAQPR